MNTHKAQETMQTPQLLEASNVANSFPFRDEYKKDPLLVSVGLGGVNNTFMTYPYTPLEAVAQYIADPQYMGKTTLDIRIAIAAGNQKERARLKCTLPSLVVGVITERRKSDYAKRYNNFFIIDVDHIKDNETAEKVKEELFNGRDLDVRMAFISPSGLGVKAVVCRDINPSLPIQEAHTECQRTINELFDATIGKKYGVVADPQAVNLLRSCFLCHDPKVMFKK